MNLELTDQMYGVLSQFISETLGLYFPPSRWPEFQRGICAAAEELGNGATPAEFASWLVTRPTLSQRHVEVLSTKLTVGETYFFREPRHFAALTDHILPEISRHRKRPAIRIWSAACCTGEEPYSIAIWLHRMAPDVAARATIIGTDINPDFLHRAQAGLFGRWSFRDAPPWLIGNYFQEKHDGQWEIIPHIRRMVRFMPLNLVNDTFPALLTDLHAMDVIFCRNVLMYFSNDQARKTLEKLYHTQRDMGWLLVGASELFHIASTPYATVRLSDAIVCQKGRDTSRTVEAMPDASADIPQPTVKTSAPFPALSVITDGQPGRPHQQNMTAQQAQMQSVPPPAPCEPSPSPSLWATLTRELAGQGKLNEAVVSVDRWIAAEKMNPIAHYLRGLIFREKGEPAEALHSLRRSLYLDPQFIVAHLALGNMERDRGQKQKAQRHVANALELLAHQDAQTIVPESDGMTARQCLDLARALAESEALV